MRPARPALLAASSLALSALVAAGAGTAAAAPSPTGVGHRNVRVCPAPPSGHAHCHAIVHEAVLPDGRPAPDATTSPTGLAPADLLSAYGWSGIGAGSGKTIAIVDAYDDPTIASDLSTFSAEFGIPCNGCLTKVNQNGGTNYPQANSGWALEISLDVEWAHAIAPGAHILLVEASSSSYSNLFAAEDYASAHAQYVSNSWGGSESSGESSYDSHFQTPGVSYFASSGDTGGAVEYPSASPYVVSVGGTTLTDTNGTWSETGWSSSGGGCSADEKANGAQVTSPNVNCGGRRATPDVASDADPNSGVDVYDSTSYYGQTGWFVVGGTSAASPVWAARSADRGVQVDAAYLYQGYPASYPDLNVAFRDITSGNNGYPAGPGYDLVTGLGSWTGGDGQTTSAAPGAPTNLTATASSSSVTLNWTAPTGTDPAASYDVYRGSASGAESLLATGVTGTTYTDPGLAAGTYYYEVSAVDSSGNQGPLSNEASATVAGSTGAPAAITATSCSGATCTFTGSGTAPLSWNFGSSSASPATTTSDTSPASVSTTYSSRGNFTVTLTDAANTSASTTVSCVWQGKGKHKTVSCS